MTEKNELLEACRDALAYLADAGVCDGGGRLMKIEAASEVLREAIRNAESLKHNLYVTRPDGRRVRVTIPQD